MSVRNSWVRWFVLAAAAIGMGFAANAGFAAAADDTVWLCKPGQADNPCLGNVDGENTLPDGSEQPLGYKPAENAPVDCFYLYPTQSKQPTDNANLNPDKELKDVAVNQARQFSRVCDVYAPVYRQYTLAGLSHVTPEMRDIAYADVLKAWKEFLANHNEGRGFILLGHSQGSSHMARLIEEEIDGNPEVRERLISAIIPGANVYVPKNQRVGGQFQNVPACETATQLGCVIAYSMYLNEPEAGSRFGRVATGYWVNPRPRPDEATYEVMCVNPADVAGTGGRINPLADLLLFITGSEGGFAGQPDYYQAECQRSSDAHWLNVSKVNPADPRPLDLADVIASNQGDLHLGDVNLAIDTLVGIAKTETETYVAAENRKRAIEEKARATTELAAAKAKLNAGQVRYRSRTAQVKKAGKKLRAAKKKCRAAKRAKVKVSARCKLQRKLTAKLKNARGQAKRSKKQVDTLKGTVSAIEARIVELNQIIG